MNARKKKTASTTPDDVTPIAILGGLLAAAVMKSADIDRARNRQADAERADQKRDSYAEAILRETAFTQEDARLQALLIRAALDTFTGQTDFDDEVETALTAMDSVLEFLDGSLLRPLSKALCEHYLMQSHPVARRAAGGDGAQ